MKAMAWLAGLTAMVAIGCGGEVVTDDSDMAESAQPSADAEYPTSDITLPTPEGSSPITATAAGTVAAPNNPNLPQCSHWADCGNPANECMRPACEAGKCLEKPADDGALCSGNSPSGQGVCIAGICGGGA
jgi:hypothetical protein